MTRAPLGSTASAIAVRLRANTVAEVIRQPSLLPTPTQGAPYQRASTIVTTNLPFKDWGKLFHDSAAASAIADRLVDKGLLVRIAGKSRRSNQEVDNAA